MSNLSVVSSSPMLGIELTLNKQTNKQTNKQLIYLIWGTWLAQSVEHANLDLRVVSSSPTLGIEITLKK